MRKSIYILLSLMLLFISCDKVKVGSWYENIKTKERVKVIDIGLPKEMLARHSEQMKRDLGDSLFTITVLDYDSTKYSNVECFMINKSANGYWLSIKPIELLNTDYLKIK